MGAKSSLYVTTLPSLVAIGIVVVEMFLSHDLARSRDSNVLWLYGSEPLILSHHSAKFGTTISTEGVEM